MSKNRAGILALLCVVLLGALALAGCANIAEKATEAAIENATGVKVDQEGDEVTFESEDGKVVASTGGGELPEGFPSDVPVYDGTIDASVATDEGFMVGIKITDDAMTVLDWYTEKAGQDGWKKTAEIKTDDGGMVMAEKDGRVFQATVGATTEEGFKTQLSLTTGDK